MSHVLAEKIDSETVARGWKGVVAVRVAAVSFRRGVRSLTENAVK